MFISYSLGIGESSNANLVEVAIFAKIWEPSENLHTKDFGVFWSFW